jgi:hypothetical protein
MHRTGFTTRGAISTTLLLHALLAALFLTCASGGQLLKNDKERPLCVAIAPLMTSRPSEFISREKDSLSRIVEECVKARLDVLGFNWARAPESCDDRIMRSFKPRLKDNNDPVDSLSYAAADLVSGMKARKIAVFYLYFDCDHSGAMRAASIMTPLTSGIAEFVVGNVLASPDDDLYVYCSCYDVGSRVATVSRRTEISEKGKASGARFREEVKKFIDESLY